MNPAAFFRALRDQAPRVSWLPCIYAADIDELGAAMGLNRSEARRIWADAMADRAAEKGARITRPLTDRERHDRRWWYQWRMTHLRQSGADFDRVMLRIEERGIGE